MPSRSALRPINIVCNTSALHPSPDLKVHRCKRRQVPKGDICGAPKTALGRCASDATREVRPRLGSRIPQRNGSMYNPPLGEAAEVQRDTAPKSRAGVKLLLVALIDPFYSYGFT